MLLLCVTMLQVLLVHAGVLHQPDHEHGGGGVHAHDGVPKSGPHCSNQFCIEAGYKKLELPPPNKDLIEVVITPHILEIFEVSWGGGLSSPDFTVRFLFSFSLTPV